MWDVCVCGGGWGGMWGGCMCVLSPTVSEMSVFMFVHVCLCVHGCKYVCVCLSIGVMFLL